MRSQPQTIRKPASSPGKLGLANGGTIACTIVNLSSGGARIDVDQSAAVPQAVHLSSEDLRLSTDATVAWRTDSQIGLRFVSRQNVPLLRAGHADT